MLLVLGLKSDLTVREISKKPVTATSRYSVSKICMICEYLRKMIVIRCCAIDK